MVSALDEEGGFFFCVERLMQNLRFISVLTAVIS